MFIYHEKEIDLLDVIGSGNIHRCREIEPHEAAIYSLQTEGQDMFSAISTAELTIAVKGSLREEHEKKRKQFSFLELPVDFSRESFAKVSV